MSLTLHEARARAAALSAVAYDLDLDLRDPAPGGTFGTRTTITFTTSGPTTFLELTAGSEVEVDLPDGAGWTYDGRRVELRDLPTGEPVTVTVRARVPYVSDGDGMHLFVDPADGETYVCAFVGIDITQRVFACFDQVDLKAPLTLAVTADPRWTVLANGRGTRDPGGSGDEGRWAFATTPPIPIDNMVVCAGPWHSVRWEHAGLPFGWHARRSLAAELDRDAAELRAVTEACFDHFAELLDEPYPFDGYDQAMVPGLNWGAQEMPGCITYRDEMLPRGRLTAQQATGRATVIAHEMSHMWFGNLVTMRWWEDTWLNESFADYMGYRVAAAAAGYDGAQVPFEALRKAGAYDADVRRSTHPVAPLAEDVPDVDTAFGNFDQISYAKGNAVLRQLVTWLGDEAFLAGVNAHVTRHAWGNATLADLVDALDAASERDVRGWVEVWLRRTGFDTVTVARDPQDREVPVLVRDGERPHRLLVTGYDDAWAPVASTWVDLDDDVVALPELRGLVVVPNAHGETMARLRLDDDRVLTEGLSAIEDDLVRAVLWQHVFERVQSRDLAVDDYLHLVSTHLHREPSAALVAAVLGRTRQAVLPRRVPAEAAAGFRDALAAACSAGLLAAGPDEEERRVALAQGLAVHERDVDRLRSWLDQDAVEGVALDPALRWGVVQRLAEVGAPGVEALVEEERRRDGTFAGDLGAARALASRPTPEAKAEAWAAAVDPEVSNRVFESLLAGLWSSEQAALCAPWVERYLAEGPHLAERRGQAFSQVVGQAFPAFPLTPEQLDAVRARAGRRRADRAAPPLGRPPRRPGLSGRRGAGPPGGQVASTPTRPLRKASTNSAWSARTRSAYDVAKPTRSSARSSRRPSTALATASSTWKVTRSWSLSSSEAQWILAVARPSRSTTAAMSSGSVMSSQSRSTSCGEISATT